MEFACQVKVRNDLDIKVKDEVLSIKKWECTVKSNDNVATFIKELVVELPEGENLNFQSGGYIQIDIPKYEVDFKNFDIEKNIMKIGINLIFGILNLKMTKKFSEHIQWQIIQQKVIL